MMINVLFYMSITRETSSCTSRKGGWLMKSLSLKMFRDETRKTKLKFTKSAEKLFLTTRTRTMMMMCTSLPPLLLKRLRVLNRFLCSSFFFFFFSITVLRSSSSSSSRGCWCFSSSSAFSFAVSLPSRVSVFYAKSRNNKAREEKSLSKILSSFSLSLSLETRARMRVRSLGVSSPLKLRTPLIRNPWTL